MRKRSMGSIVAVMAAVATLAVTASAADPSAAQPVPGQGAAPKRSAPADLQRPETGELPQILIVAAVNLRAKNDPEVQALLDKAIADLQVVQTDEAARLIAFQQLVQAERGGNADAIQKARDGVNSANVKLVAHARQFNQAGRRTAAKKSPRAHSPRRSDAGGGRSGHRVFCGDFREVIGGISAGRRRCKPSDDMPVNVPRGRLRAGWRCRSRRCGVPRPCRPAGRAAFSSSRRSGDCASGQDSASALAFFISELICATIRRRFSFSSSRSRNRLRSKPFLSTSRCRHVSCST